MHDLLMKIYTDGASSNNQSENRTGGYAGIVYVKQLSANKIFEPREVFGGSIGATNNQMELKAILESINTIKPSISPKARVEIYTDSRYCINIWKKSSAPGTPYIENWKKNGWKNSKKKPVENQGYITAIDDILSRFPQVEFLHVKGHAKKGTKEYCQFNDYVDRLASYYAGSRNTLPEKPEGNPF